MNLIEQLGGYEKGKAMNKFIQIDSELLEYRRQHNIYDVGDYVLPNSNHSNEVHFLSEWYIDGLDFRYKTNSGDWGVIVKSCMTDSWRHATDEEIAAGKRLEVD